MGLELRKVADTIMSDLGMGEDQDKIDALEQYLEENLSIFFSEDSYMSSVIKMGAEKSFTSHSAKIKDFLTRGVGGGTIMEGATPTGTSSSQNLAIGELTPFQKENLSEEETATIYTARAILEGLMKREREADADHGPEGADAGNPEPEPEGEAKEEFYDTTPVKTGLAFSFGAESPLIKIAKGIEDEEKALWESKSAEIMKSIMPEILDEATTFLSRIWAGGLGDVIRESLDGAC